MDILLPLLVVKGLELTLTASVIAFVALLLRRFGRSLLGPRAICWLWLLVLLKLSLPLSVPSPFSMENGLDRYLYGTYGVTGVLTAAGKHWNEMSKRAEEGDTTSAPSREMRMYRNGEEMTMPLPPADRQLLESVRAQTGLTNVLIAMACLWLGGSCIYAAIGWARGLRTRRLIQSALPCEDPELLQLLESCKKEAGIRGHVRLLRSGSLFPALYGAFRPTILLPYDYDRKYSAEELRFILLHELMHCKYKDLLLFDFSRLLQIMYWLNPVVHAAMAAYRDDMELRCDSRVLQLLSREERTRYGMLLIKQGEMNSPSAAPAAFGANWLAGRSQLIERIGQIARFRSERRSKAKAMASVVLIATLFLWMLPSHHLYATMYRDNTPTLYVFWLHEQANPGSMQTITSMAEQMSGVAAATPQVALLLKSNVDMPIVQQTWVRLRLLSGAGKEAPIAVETRPIRDRIREAGLREGKLLIMLQYPYAYAKYWGFGISKNAVTDLSSIERLERLNVY